MIVLMFPGQGAQAVGMGRELAREFACARRAYEEASDVLGYDLGAVCFTGPADRLTRTDVCQPAILATSVATWRAAAEHGLAGDLVMGHSLGEYSALVAAGGLDYAEAVALVAERGAAMQQAGETRPGTMAAVMGMADADAEALCDEAGGVWTANLNCPGQVVVSGEVDGVERLVALASARGARTSRLAVGGAFHSPLMAPAAARLGPALAALAAAEPAPPFLSTTTVRVEPAGRLRAVLLDQLTSPVRFGAAIEAALEMGAEHFVELGPGRVLSGLVRRVRRDVSTAQVGAPADLAALAA